MKLKHLNNLLVILTIFLLIGCGGSSSNSGFSDSKLIANSQDISLKEDRFIRIKLSVNNYENKNITYTIIKKPSHGILTGDLPNLNYTPNKNYFGNDVFAYNVSNGLITSLPATVKIKIKPVNDKPIVDAGNDMNVTISNYARFKAYATDVDGKIVKYTWKENGIILSSTPNFTKNNFAKGKHTITLTVTDNEGAISTDTLILRVGKYIKSKAILNKGSNIVTYDLNEQPLINKYDSDLDGVPESITSYIYNTDGLKTKQINDANADGIVDFINTYAYDSFGHEVNSTNQDANGIVKSITKSSYDSNGNRITYSYCNAQGIPYTTFSTTYNSFHKSLITKITDNHGTHTNRIETYDTKGNLLSRAYDSDTDYRIDSNITYSYALDGKKLSETYDTNNDGVADRIITFAYDINGYLSNKKIDNNANGTIDSTQTYLYDSQGNKLSESYDFDNDGIADKSIAYIYNENNNLLSKIIDENADGTTDTTMINIYTNGNLVKTMFNNEVQNTYEWSFVY